MKFAFFIGDVYQKYASEAISAAMKCAEENGITLHIFASFPTPDGKFLHAAGQKSIYHLPNLADYDAVMINSDTMVRFGYREELLEKIKREAKCPVISLRSREKDCFSIVIRDEDAIYNMTRHFIEVHKMKRICFVTGRIEAEDAVKRFVGYKRAMKEADIPVTDDMVFYGNYWRNKARETVDYFTDREVLPEAIVCSNDYEALSVTEELIKRGFRVPEDIAVSGFDNVEETKISVPLLTTLEIPFDEFGRLGILWAKELVEGKSTSNETNTKYVDSVCVYRESCGCQKDMVFDKKGCYSEMVRYRNNNAISSYMSADFDNATDEKEAFEWVKYYMMKEDIDKCYICLRKQSSLYEFEDSANKSFYSDTDIVSFVKQETAISLRAYFDNKGNFKIVDIPFEEKNYLPAEFATELEGKGSIFIPINSKNEVFGYFVMLPGEKLLNKIPDYMSTLSMFFGSALKRMYMHRELFKMQDVMKLYLKDPLTDVYNRRGFDEKFITCLEKCKAENKQVYLVSFDMDGLKQINDNFGHSRGDSALIGLSDAIKDSLKEDEFCGRMGGDEFSVILVADDESRVAVFEETLKQKLIGLNSKITDDYKIDASYGIRLVDSFVPFEENMEKADEKMYEQKREKKKLLESGK